MHQSNLAEAKAPLPLVQRAVFQPTQRLEVRSIHHQQPREDLGIIGQRADRGVIVGYANQVEIERAALWRGLEPHVAHKPPAPLPGDEVMGIEPVIGPERIFRQIARLHERHLRASILPKARHRAPRRASIAMTAPTMRCRVATDGLRNAWDT